MIPAENVVCLIDPKRLIVTHERILSRRQSLKRVKIFQNLMIDKLSLRY